MTEMTCLLSERFVNQVFMVLLVLVIQRSHDRQLSKEKNYKFAIYRRFWCLLFVSFGILIFFPLARLTLNILTDNNLAEEKQTLFFQIILSFLPPPFQIPLLPHLIESSCKKSMANDLLQIITRDTIIDPHQRCPL